MPRTKRAHPRLAIDRPRPRADAAPRRDGARRRLLAHRIVDQHQPGELRVAVLHAHRPGCRARRATSRPAPPARSPSARHQLGDVLPAPPRLVAAGSGCRCPPARADRAPPRGSAARRRRSAARRSRPAWSSPARTPAPAAPAPIRRRLQDMQPHAIARDERPVRDPPRPPGAHEPEQDQSRQQRLVEMPPHPR